MATHWPQWRCSAPKAKRLGRPTSINCILFSVRANTSSLSCSTCSSFKTSGLSSPNNDRTLPIWVKGSTYPKLVRMVQNGKISGNSVQYVRDTKTSDACHNLNMPVFPISGAPWNLSRTSPSTAPSRGRCSRVLQRFTTSHCNRLF